MTDTRIITMDRAGLIEECVRAAVEKLWPRLLKEYGSHGAVLVAIDSFGQSEWAGWYIFHETCNQYRQSFNLVNRKG